MKDVVTAWQLRDADAFTQVINDHTDAAYDQAVLDRLGARARRCRRLARAAPGWLPAAGRLWRPARPSDRAPAFAGDGRYVASPRVDSYHGIWFELHEDLIQLAGRTRADEAAAGRA